MRLNYQITNFVLFQLGWFACVIFASKQMDIVSITCVSIILITHIRLITERKQELILILITGGIGFVVDSINYSIDVIVSTQQHLLYSGMAPLWLVSLWMLFASTLNHSLNWLGKRLFLAALLGSIFAPLSYYAGSVFSALKLNEENLPYSLTVIGLQWLVVTPILFWIQNKLSLSKQKQNNSLSPT